MTALQIISLIVIGVHFGELIFQLLLLYYGERKILHVYFIAAFLGIISMLAFNNHFGIMATVWSGYDYSIIKYVLFFSLNIFIVSVNFIFAQLPRFRKSNKNIMFMFTGIVTALCVLYLFLGIDYHDILIAIDAGTQLMYLVYVMIHLIKTIRIDQPKTYMLLLLFLLYVIFIIVTSVYAATVSRERCWVHFMVGSIFPVSLSFVIAIRQFTSLIKGRNDTKSQIATDVAKRIDELQYSISSKDKFFSIIAHDLKSPISSIKTLSEIYSEEAVSSNDPHAKELAEAFRNSIDSLCSILDDLLNWARSQTGAMQFVPSYIDIGTLVENVKKNVYAVCSAKNIAMKVSINERDKLYGDANMLQTILRNLITNAVKYSYNDSLITLDFSAEGFYSIIKVTDNGVGMNKEELHNLFLIEKLSSRPGTNKEPGNGLGLIVCHEFVEKHNGTITVETEENLGTTFTIRIPYMRYMTISKEALKSGK